MAVELSYCVVSTEKRQLLRYCLDAIARERASVPFETEVLVLDNASTDGSAEAARAHPATTAARHAALSARPRAGAACATLVLPDGTTPPPGPRLLRRLAGARPGRV